MDPLHLIQFYHEGRFGQLRNLKPCPLYRIVHIRKICLAEMAWFLIHTREGPSDTLSEVYVYIQADDMFTTKTEFAINRQLIIVHLLYDGERVAVIGRRMR